MSDNGQELNELYEIRFGNSGDKQRSKKDEIWNVLCEKFFQKYIPESVTICDIAAGYCEFINNIKAKRKVAIDLNPAIRENAASDVEVICDNIFNLDKYLKEGEIDCFFVSNFLEHLDSKQEVIKLMKYLSGKISPKGSIVILQPNIKLVKGAYWDFIDHKTELTEKSLMELATMCGLKVEKCITRFLPYTTKSALPQNAFFIKLYLLLMPFSGFFFGKQSFLVLRKG